MTANQIQYEVQFVYATTKSYFVDADNPDEAIENASWRHQKFCQQSDERAHVQLAIENPVSQVVELESGDRVYWNNACGKWQTSEEQQEYYLYSSSGSSL
tara:strand:- start:1568 stop:1867 length:300 start_codon:yes stop_codon:yes gene_type:complete